MSRFFIGRPIVAMVIAIVMVILGLVAMLDLPISQFPNIAPPEINISTTYVGADAVTVMESVATPIEQAISGVEDMIYMYSTNANNGQMTLRVDFEPGTDPNTDQILTQMRYSQSEAQLPIDVRNFGVTIEQASSSPLALFSVYSPGGTYDALFLANYVTINALDPMSRVNGIGQVQVFGAGEYAMRLWVDPDTLAKLQITVPEIVEAIETQNTVNPAGQLGAEPVPPGQQFTYTVRAQGRLKSVEEFENIVVRATPDGSFVRVKDVARVELGAQTYNLIGRFNGKPAAILAIYQQPGSNAIATMNAATALMDDLQTRFPDDLDYSVSLDTTLAVRAGVEEIVITLFEALGLVILVVFIFLQGFRATLIPLLAVPVSLVGTFMLFPVLGFSINTLSLFGLVLAIGIVVDDAIVVVEAVELNIENGMSSTDAALKAMEAVTSPIVATTLILVAVFLPTAFIPGITGSLYQQFAVTIAVSVVISSINALTLSPALSALLLRPRTEMRGPLGRFFGGFNRVFDRVTHRYVGMTHFFIRRLLVAVGVLGGVVVLIVGVAGRIPSSFLPQEDQGYLLLNAQLPAAASLQRADEYCQEVEKLLEETEGVAGYNTIVGFSLISNVQSTYLGFFFIALDPWDERDPKGLTASVMMQKLNQKLEEVPGAISFSFPPPAIPGVGSSGGITFMLEDRTGQGVEYLAEQTKKFIEAAQARPELGMVRTTFQPDVPQILANVNREKTMKQGVELSSVYQVLQAYNGGLFINYFNRFGRVWQVYIEAEGAFRTDSEKLGQFYVRNNNGGMVPLSTLVDTERIYGPEFTLRFNQYGAAQLMVGPAPGYSGGQAMAALEEVFAETMPEGMGYDYMGMAFQAKKAAMGISPTVIFAFSLLMVFLILAAQYESWGLPMSVLLTTPVAVLGAFVGVWARSFDNDLYFQIGLVMLIGLSAKNAILIVEYARSRLAEGESIVQAALDAARIRLRPILMTAFAFILGVVPLVIATGSGAISRRILGTAVMGGMLASTCIAIFLVPATFALVEKLTHRGDPAAQDPPAAPGDGA
ncbi:MAG: multidrug efflux RND transporter permease subunit [Myxococcota bacterium]|jgi:HAE1 family hydrophobic/amphiphilic exporter-1|nr:hydrophobe/amphiphile efflux-1 family RND transporter [Deltaproteobacteria bacterium]MCP4241658.1 multidrug efflux RND transporter permease subunit [bacterium]MDP6075443.1 multidrug efflux RND transporter permease subunit [Myxococcota bacterium]MDP7075657.1 multidrug efflux RND transporter permease subunit [Myxococcota bacterium]MDP7297885.1 multidrug efflux RND transporter permease subunit [Myxococcota bacterium]